jgi:hypothetical protein
MVKMVLIAYHMLESSFGAYIEWLVNEMMMTANKKKYKDPPLVMLLAVAINPQAKKPCIILGVFFFPPDGKVLRSTVEYSGFILPCCK